MNRLAGLISNDRPDHTKSQLALMFKSINEDGVTSHISNNCHIGICGDNMDQQVSEIENVITAIDGRIYNRKELLEFLPKNAKTIDLSNAEIITFLYKRYGFKQAIALTNGDFAIQLYDTNTKELFIARDRFGARPMHYVQFDGKFAFASRIQSLLSLEGVKKKPNNIHQHIFAGAHYRLVDNRIEETAFENIYRLPACHIMQVNAVGEIKMEKYWALQPVEFSSESEESLAETYRDLLVGSVRDRIQSINGDARAFLLSGGMDSSSILASAASVENMPQTAFTSVYDDPEFDERDDVQDMLQKHVAQWNPINIENEIDVFGLIDKMVALHDEPVITATWLSHYLVCQTVSKQGIKVLFGGLGGDELNAGEYEYFPCIFSDLQRQGKGDQLNIEINAWIKNHDHPVFRKTPEIAYQLIERQTDSNNPGLCKPDWLRLQRYQDTLDDPSIVAAERPYMESPFTDCLRNRTFQDLTRETTPCCLRAEDRHASAFGMENINPFLDYKLVEFMFQVPTEMKIRNGVTKYLLRKAMKGILPEATRTRISKRGWNAPAHQWFLAPKNQSNLRDMISSQDFREWGLYDVRRVEEIVNEHIEIVSSGAPKENHMMFLWQLCNLYSWKRKFC